VRGLGNAGGFKLMVEATGDVDFDALQTRRTTWPCKGISNPVSSAYSTFPAGRPSFLLDVDRPRSDDGVQLTDVFDALQAYWQLLRQDFNRSAARGRSTFRQMPRFGGRGHGPTAQGPQRRWRMVPLGAVADVRASAGPRQITPVQHVSGDRDHRRLCPGSATATYSRRWTALRTRNCR